MHLYAWLHILLAYTCRHFTCNVMVIECVCVCVAQLCVCVLIEFCVCVCPLVFLLLYDLCNHAFLYSHVSYMYIKCYVCICMYCNMYMYTCVHIYCISNEFCIFCFVCCSQCQHSLDSVTALHTDTPSSSVHVYVQYSLSIAVHYYIYSGSF